MTGHHDTTNRSEEENLSDQIQPHLTTTLYFTLAYITAWGWNLVVYGVSHVLNGENPLQDQLSFGDHSATKHLAVLVLEFLMVCSGSAIVSDLLGRDGRKWTIGATTAVQFFPAAIFGGKLMGYLGQFAHLGSVQRALINLAATLFSAFLATSVPMTLGPPFTAFGKIVRDSMGFGLGIAWNVFTLSIFAPDKLDTAHIIGLAGYLALVLLIAFRVAAEGSYVDTLEREPNMIDRMWPLLSFAMNTASAFTLVAFVNSMTHEGWVGDIECFFILLIFSAFLAAGVSKIDVSSSREDANEEMENGRQNCGMDHLPCVLKVLVFVPCFWCCCPWVPMIFLLSGVHGIGVKEKWFSLVSMISGLAASIEASGMLTASANAIAGALGICNAKHCPEPWIFVSIQVAIATTTTIILIPTLILLVPPFLWSPEDQEQERTTTTTIEYISKGIEDTISLLSPTTSSSNEKSRSNQYNSV
ncbi:hypothetical protein IV203_034507 [Nitzschia inconspicua]|uniref:Uncharacterized protein n=1 Tax=Nitzschia inconspicua TaxID=303405 RepID=A0A9K3LCX4_9STRA|nr:hypothetical protein IV203_002696 [Nitzschia inconspicua]KAG7339510.1 hypothetical protein IV203_002563 [Nitzschia inconspicua]KAG7359409.1 hypothetical protein IV203_034507 [Nitzschia inconspicua]